MAHYARGKKEGLMGEEEKTLKNGPTSEEKAFSSLAYVGVLCLVSALVKKDSKFVKFHIRQGMVLFIIEVVAGLLIVIPVLGHIVLLLISLLCGILSLIGIIHALMGNKWEIPFIKTWAEKMTI